MWRVCDAIVRYVALCGVMGVMWRYVALYGVMWRNVASCGVMIRYVALCDGI